MGYYLRAHPRVILGSAIAYVLLSTFGLLYSFSRHEQNIQHYSLDCDRRNRRPRLRSLHRLQAIIARIQGRTSPEQTRCTTDPRLAQLLLKTKTIIRFNLYPR
jgi:hypothetical protein